LGFEINNMLICNSTSSIHVRDVMQGNFQIISTVNETEINISQTSVNEQAWIPTKSNSIDTYRVCPNITSKSTFSLQNSLKKIWLHITVDQISIVMKKHPMKYFQNAGYRPSVHW
jgi:hypothetical protein